MSYSYDRSSYIGLSMSKITKLLSTGMKRSGKVKPNCDMITSLTLTPIRIDDSSRWAVTIYESKNKTCYSSEYMNGRRNLPECLIKVFFLGKLFDETLETHTVGSIAKLLDETLSTKERKNVINTLLEWVKADPIMKKHTPWVRKRLLSILKRPAEAAVSLEERQEETKCSRAEAEFFLGCLQYAMTMYNSHERHDTNSSQESQAIYRSDNASMISAAITHLHHLNFGDPLLPASALDKIGAEPMPPELRDSALGSDALPTEYRPDAPLSEDDQTALFLLEFMLDDHARTALDPEG